MHKKLHYSRKTKIQNTSHKKKVLIIDDKQFGYLNRTYYLNKYFKKYYNIFNLCHDLEKSKIKLDGVKVEYVPFKGNKIFKKIRFINRAISEIKNHYDLIFVNYFIGCSLLKIFSPYKNIVLDIDTGYISEKKILLSLFNMILFFESLFFKKITIISEGLRELLKINKNKVHIFPVGSDIVSVNKKKFDVLRILYVGVLGKKRKLENTILGLKKFYREYNNKLSIKYTIIGSGPSQSDLIELVKKNKLNNVINIIGYVPHEDLKKYFDTHNIGISYVPILKCYNFQPPTKTFELLAAGMPVIATNTFENRRLINKKNGVLIADTAEGIYHGLKKIIKYNGYDSYSIRQSIEEYTWNHIMNQNLKIYFRDVIHN
jgi:glycosyltransferase involved in cell wall biosynthesis